MFLSIFPILILLCSVLPYTHISKGDLIAVVTNLLPSNIDPLAVSIIDEMYAQSFAALSLSAVFVIWSAAKGMLALLRGLNSVEEVEETRNYFMVRLRSCFYTLILLALITSSLIVLVFGNSIVQAIVDGIPQTEYLFDLLMPFRYLFILFFMAALFACVYAFMPNRKNNFFLKIPGALFSGLGWVVFSWGFSIYVDRFGNFNMYGSLTTIVIVMLWLYFCMYLLLLGGEINAFLYPFFSLVFMNRKIRRKYQKEKKEQKELTEQKRQKEST